MPERDEAVRQVALSLRALDIRPTKGKGQNFLTTLSVVERIADLVEATPNDLVIEVGPGLGALTEALVERAGEVRAIELDERLADHLLTTFSSKRLTVIAGDAMTLDESLFVPENRKYLFAANLPYSVGAAIVRRFLELDHPPERMVVMLQREVGERIAATPPNMSILGVAVQLYATARVAFHVPPSAFKPRPKVESSVLVIEPHAEPLLDRHEREGFFRVVHAGFHQKRKQLGNTIAAGLAIEKDVAQSMLERAGIDPQRRAETVSVDEWIALHRVSEQSGG